MAIDIYQKFVLGKETFHPLKSDSDTFQMDWWMEPGGTVPQHIHRYMDEHFEIISGTATFIVGGKKVTKNKNDELFIPKGVAHGIKNNSSEILNIKVTYTPAADTAHMFKIIAFLNQKYPGQASNMVKYFYMYPKLGLKPFSEFPSPLIMRTLAPILNMVGFLAGWKKLVKAYKQTN